MRYTTIIRTSRILCPRCAGEWMDRGQTVCLTCQYDKAGSLYAACTVQDRQGSRPAGFPDLGGGVAAHMLWDKGTVGRTIPCLPGAE